MEIKEGNFYKEKEESTIIKVLKIINSKSAPWALVKKNYNYIVNCTKYSCKYYKICLKDKSLTCEYIAYIEAFCKPISKIEVALKAPQLLEDSVKI